MTRQVVASRFVAIVCDELIVKLFWGKVVVFSQVNAEGKQVRWFGPKIGRERIKSWFALLPVCIDGECRWLERVHVRQRGDWDLWCSQAVWRNAEFVEADQIKGKIT